MSRNKEQNKLIRDEKREKILNAALKIFAEKGLAAAKISDIAASANLSYGLVYHYFKTKEDVFIEVVKQTIELSNDSIRTILLAEGDSLNKLKYMAKSNISNNNLEENAFRWLIMVQAVISDSVPPVVKDIVVNSSKLLDYIKELIIRGQKDGKIISADPARLATAYLSMIQGLVFFRTYGENVAPMPDEEIVMRLLKG